MGLSRCGLASYKCLKKFVLFVMVMALFAILINLCSMNSLRRKSALKGRAFQWKTNLIVLVLSHRDAFTRHELIRQMVSRDHSVFFMIGHHCPLPPEQRMPRTCGSNNMIVSDDRVKEYLGEEEEKTARLKTESNVVLLPLIDVNSQFLGKVTLAYRWALQNTNADWILITNDTDSGLLTSLEEYLRNNFDPAEKLIIKPRLYMWRPTQVTEINESILLWSVGNVVSRSAVHFFMDHIEPLFEDGTDGFLVNIKIVESSPLIQAIIRNKSNNVTVTDLGIENNTPKMLSDDSKKLKTKRLAEKKSSRRKQLAQIYSNSDSPDAYLHSDRFDIIVKMVYAYFYSVVKFVPDSIKLAYTEHLRVWNHFDEKCAINDKRWFDAKIPCKDKKNISDYISSFHHTIESIQKHGFESNTSQIPVDVTGFALNGAHRLAAAIILGKNVTIQHLNYKKHYDQNYKFYMEKGLSTNLANLVMLEWMKIQTKLPNLNTTVSILAIYLNKPSKNKEMREIVNEFCSKDNNILYEQQVIINRFGIKQLITHLYGNKPWLRSKQREMLLLFKSDNLIITYIFFFGKDEDQLTNCKKRIRTLYKYERFKSSAHIPDTPEESLILAEMILNPNSIQFLNHAKNGKECQTIAEELALRSSLKPINTLEGIYIGRNDIMIDSGAVLQWFNVRERGDLDVLFLNEIDKRVLGKLHDIYIEPHAFKSNAMHGVLPLGEAHFNDKVKTKWDLFYDPDNYGYCYGIKFVSLKQIVVYKQQRKVVREKDKRDVELISDKLKSMEI